MSQLVRQLLSLLFAGMVLVVLMFFPLFPTSAGYRAADSPAGHPRPELLSQNPFWAPKYKIKDGRLYLRVSRSYTGLILVTGYSSTTWTAEDLAKLPVDSSLWPAPEEPLKGVRWLEPELLK